MRRRLLLVALTALVAVVLLVGPRAGSALVVSAPISSPDAIVSLASHEWERLPATARLAAENPLALVILTLPQPATKYNCHDCPNRPERLRRAGVDLTRIRIIPITASGTHGEALATRDFMAKAGLRRLDVVTSPYHTRRSLATFRAALEEIGAVVGIVPATETSPAQPAQWWKAPYDRAYVRYEWAAVVYYWIRYRVPLVPAIPARRQASLAGRRIDATDSFQPQLVDAVSTRDTRMLVDA